MRLGVSPVQVADARRLAIGVRHARTAEGSSLLNPGAGRLYCEAPNWGFVPNLSLTAERKKSRRPPCRLSWPPAVDDGDLSLRSADEVIVQALIRAPGSPNFPPCVTSASRAVKASMASSCASSFSAAPDRCCSGAGHGIHMADSPFHLGPPRHRARTARVLGVGADVPATIGDAVLVPPGFNVQVLERLDHLARIEAFLPSLRALDPVGSAAWLLSIEAGGCSASCPKPANCAPYICASLP